MSGAKIIEGLHEAIQHAKRDKMTEWQPIPTHERLPEKPSLESYEHVRCLIFIRNEWQIGMWNCEHLCWDDDDGDDFLYEAGKPSHWMPLPPPPAALAAKEGE
jgi:hypothetical protein